MSTPTRPAADARSRRTWGRRLRFLSRFLGLTALLLAAAGGVCAVALNAEPTPEAWGDALTGKSGTLGLAAGWLLAAGVLLLTQSLAVEAGSGLWLAAGRRSAAGTLAGVQVILAFVLFAGVNIWAFSNYRRVDLTRERSFTLPPEIRDQLAQLKVPTRVVVVQQHRTFGRLSDKPDAYDFAAERAVVEKVRDLVGLFREFGPRFEVSVLDVEDEGYDRAVARLTAGYPALKSAIDASPENSVFFNAVEPATGVERVQRLGFNEFLQLDKTASKAANAGKGNLVLLPQGVEAFARKVLAIEERKPRVALGVIHEFLSSAETEGNEQFTAAGARKSLEAYGFEVTDVILKRRWEERGKEPEPAAYTVAESRLDSLEEELALLSDQAREQSAALSQTRSATDAVKSKKLSELDTEFPQRGGRKWTEADRSDELEQIAAATDSLERSLARVTKYRDRVEAELREIYGNEGAIEDRRVADVKAKLRRVLEGADLLILPRQTLINISIRFALPPNLYKLSQAQVDVIKEFMAAGKPVLACLGPANEDGGAAVEPIDDFEKALTELGVELGKQTVLFDSETKGFAERRGGRTLGASPREVPPIAARDSAAEAGKPANPVGAALRTIARSVEQRLDLRLPHLRPVYLSAKARESATFAGEFLLSDPDSWNEDKPFPQMQRIGGGLAVLTGIPKFEETKRGDPKYRTNDAERRGPFPVGVALEATPPKAWAAPNTDPKPARLAVLGHGGFFVANTLKPAQEALLLASANWLLGREDRLPRADLPEWSYPRLEMSEPELRLWHWGTFLGLPALVAYLGVVTLMFRRVR